LRYGIPGGRVGLQVPCNRHQGTTVVTQLNKINMKQIHNYTYHGISKDFIKGWIWKNPKTIFKQKQFLSHFRKYKQLSNELDLLKMQKDNYKQISILNKSAKLTQNTPVVFVVNSMVMTTLLGAGYSTWKADTCTANTVLVQFKGHNSGVGGLGRL